MYEQYYGLKEKPFSLTPDPDFLFLNKDFREALEQLLYGIRRREGFTVLVGDVGTGKTTLCWALLGRLERNVRTALILNPLLTEEDMLRAILADFGVRPKEGAAEPEDSPDGSAAPYDPSWMRGLTRKELIDELNRFLLEAAADDITNILVIDEAQNLSPGVLEQLRILSNLETPKRKLLQIIFVGQVEFEQKLSLPELRQLNQRITIRYELRPLSREDCEAYVVHRMRIAGSTGKVSFSPKALKEIHRRSAGYPRLVNIIADWALLAGFSERARLITPKLVRKAVRGLRGRAQPIRVRSAIRPRVWVPVALAAGVLLLAALLAFFYRDRLPQVLGYTGETQPTAAPAGRAEAPLVPPMQDDDGDAAGESGPESDGYGLASAPPPADEPAAAGGNEEDYILQVHSLDTQAKAAAAVAQLDDRGFSAFQRLRLDRGGNEWFVVYVGPFISVGRAQESAARLRDLEGLSPILRRITQQ